MHSAHTSGNTGHCKLSTSVNTAGTNILLLLLAARVKVHQERTHICARALTQRLQPALQLALGSLAVCPAAGICPASSTGHTSPCGPTPGAGTPDPLTNTQTLITEPSGMWPWTLYSSRSPEPPVTSCTNIHTNRGPSQTPVSAALGLD